MRLKRLEILGFKSFADKTRLQFDAGITAIVGPNGCGKSNIADAFRWVLGEQSAKSMRGTKMPDVIFAGTATRKPLNFAEVTITLTDIAGELPIEYDEVAVTRRLHRSGESDYFINRHPVRLKDVQNLFLDSGMGKDAYSIFEQGKIDQVINFTPLERRYIFEEAAGILRFLQRKKEALRKLEQTDANICRVKDIHLEVEKQIIVLEQQAEKARIYKENKVQLEELEKKLIVVKWDQLRKRLQETSLKGESQQHQTAGLRQQLEASRQELKEAKERVAAGEKVLKLKSEEVFKTRSEKEIKSKERLSHQERLKEILSKEKKWEQELVAMGAKETARQEEKKALELQKVKLEKEVEEREKEASKHREKIHEGESLLQQMREKQHSRQQEMMQALQKQNQSESLLKQNNIRLENVQDKLSFLEKRKASLAAMQLEFKQAMEEKQKLAEETSKAVDAQREAFNALETTLQNLAEEVHKNQGDMDIMQQELADGKARQKVLLRLKNEREGFSSGSKELLQESENPQSSLYQKIKGIYEFLVPEKGYEEAVAAAMHPYAQTLVVQGIEDFQTVLAFADQRNLKDYSLFCLEKALKPTAGKTEKISLASHVSKNSISAHFLAAMEVGKEIPLKSLVGKEYCTLDGLLMDIRQVFFNTAKSENNIFVREAELKALDNRLDDLENARKQLESILKTLQQKKNEIQNQRIELDKSIRRSEMKLVEINFGLQRMKSDQEKAVIETAQMAEELKKLTAEIETLKKTQAEWQEHHQLNTQTVKKIQESLNELNGKLQQKIDLQKQQKHEQFLKESSRQKAAEDFERCKHALHVIEVKEQESRQHIKRLEEEIQNCRLLHSQISMKSSEFEKILQEVESCLAHVQAACTEHEQEVAASKTLMEHIEKKIEEKQQRLNKSENDSQQLSFQTSNLQTSIQSLQAEMRERHQTSIEEVLKETALDKGVDVMERQIRSLRQELANAGDINMTSIEECEKNRSRYHFLNLQMDDLNVSKQELVQIIAQLDGESRKIFKQTFEAISTNFKKNFNILFNGGEADLQFTETNDVLEAGIEIIAKPPGKQMRSINLLSGGEKCLTALALLFAIFEVKPAPFCILDEIDAPLDDTNVERFANIVTQYIDRCQFIIITHNKRTMTIADILFGVSMEEKGVSKLLSMEFSNQNSPEPVLVE